MFQDLSLQVLWPCSCLVASVPSHERSCYWCFTVRCQRISTSFSILLRPTLPCGSTTPLAHSYTTVKSCCLTLLLETYKSPVGSPFAPRTTYTTSWLCHSFYVNGVGSTCMTSWYRRAQMAALVRTQRGGSQTLSRTGSSMSRHPRGTVKKVQLASAI